mgnify:CR=1 FL=1|tara:strand:- start:2122 stop:3489 length:1368 start_codon:yes stop_codon:yes gene_type:complete
MGSAAGQPNYGIFEVIKKRRIPGPMGSDRTIDVDIKGKVLSFNYYESLYSPMVTASFLEIDTGGTVNSRKDDFAGTLKDGLPVEGFEQVRVKVFSKGYKSVNWTKTDRRFVITGSPFNVDEGTRQTAYFPMISINAMKGSSKPIEKIYPEAKISDIVKAILRDADLPFKKENIEETENTMKVTGNNENPLDLILKLCPKSIAVDGDPGFFFYENSEGYNFKSIHGMIKDGNKKLSAKGLDRFGYADDHTYIYRKGIVANLDSNLNDFNVLAPPTVRRDQDQINAIKNGVYNIKVCIRNIVTQEVTEQVINVYNNDKTVTLGNEIKKNNDNVQTENPNDYCRTYTFQLVPGVDKDEVSNVISNSPDKYLPRAIMRYGLIHSQLVNIIIPCNARLTVGDCIRLNFENITQDNKIEKELNEHRSGNYLIMHLCHAFTPNNSFTSLTLARDEYGLNRKI